MAKPSSAAEIRDLGPAGVLDHLMECNSYYQKTQDLEALKSRVQHHAPVVLTLSCSDARHQMAESIGQHEIGHTFEIEVAGNVVNDDVLATMEYGVDHLGIPLIFIVGHMGCGAVTGAHDGLRTGTNLDHLLDKINPPDRWLEKRRELNPELDSLAIMISANVDDQVDHTLEDPRIKRAVEDGSLVVAGGVYHLETGKVHLIRSVSSETDEALRF